MLINRATSHSFPASKKGVLVDMNVHLPIIPASMNGVLVLWVLEWRWAWEWEWVSLLRRPRMRNATRMMLDHVHITDRNSCNNTTIIQVETCLCRTG